MNQRKLGALLSYAIIGLQGIVGVVFTPYLLRMLGTSEYGLYSLVSSLISYLALLDLGFGDSVVRYTVRYKTEGKDKELHSLLGLFWTVYIVIGVVAVLAGSFLSFNMQLLFEDSMTTNEINRARIMMLLLTFNLGVTFFFTIYRSFIEANEQFVFVRLVNFCRILLNTFIMIILLNLGYKAVAQVALMTILNCLVMFSYLLYSKEKLKIIISFKSMEWKKLGEILGFSFFIFLNTIIGNIFWSSGQFVLGIYEGTKTVAIYAIVVQLTQIYRNFTTSISNVFFPKITVLTTEKNKEGEISNLFIRIGRLQFAVILYILSSFILFGQSFVSLWVGKDYGQVYALTLVYFIALIPSQTQQVGWIITKAKNQLKFRTYTYIVLAVICFMTQFPMSKYFGMVGTTLTIGTTLVVMEGFVLNIYYYKFQNINIPLFWKEILVQSIVPFVLTVISFFILKGIYINSWFSLAIAASCFSFAFVLLYIIFSANDYEKSLLRKTTCFFKKKKISN